jgi:hypothetical protein
MKDAVTKIWDKDCEDALDKMVSIFRKSIIIDAETFASFSNSNNITSQALEVALYKSIMTLNESNKSILFKKMGPIEASKLIQALELKAIEDVSLAVLEELEENFENLPSELQELVKILRKKMSDEEKRKKEQ